jgi:hypothetical protein
MEDVMKNKSLLRKLQGEQMINFPIGKTVKNITKKPTWRNEGNIEKLILEFTDNTKLVITASTDADEWDGSTNWLNLTRYDKNGKYIGGE